MARATFGGGAGDFVFRTTPGRLVSLAAATLTFWDASAGGNKHTDLLIGGSPVTEITVGEDGMVPEFEGPDGVYAMWADTGTGTGRVTLTAAGDAAADAVQAAADAQFYAGQAAQVAGLTGEDSAVQLLLQDTTPSLTRAAADVAAADFANTATAELYAALLAGFARGQIANHPRWGADPAKTAAENTTALQACADFVGSQGGGKVFVQAGTYNHNLLTIPDHVEFEGAGIPATCFRLADGANTDSFRSVNFDTLTGTNATVHPSYVGLANLRVDGNKANNPGGGGVKIYARAVFIDHVVIHDCKGDGLYTEGPASGAGVSSWDNLPPGGVRWLACIENDGNGWTHKGHSDMHVGFYHAVINTGHGLRMETVTGVTRSTMMVGELRISSNGVAAGSRGVYLTGSGTDLICGIGRFENNGGAGIYADTNTSIRVAQTQLLQNCKVADAAQAILNGAHGSRLGQLVVRDPWLSTTDGVQVINSNGVEIDGGINGTTDPTGPAAGVASTGIGLKLQGGGTAGGLFDVRIRDYNGAGASGLRTGDSAGIVGNRVRASILNCTTAWWNVNAGFGNLYDITATVSAGQSTVGGGAAGNPGAGGDARVFGNDGAVQVYP